MQGKRIFIAGGSGLIGSNLVKRLHASGIHVRANYHCRKPDFHEDCFIQADFTDPSVCRDVIQGFDYVILSAAQIYGAKITKEYPTISILPNLQMNCNLLDACCHGGVRKIIFISSGTIYQDATHPIRESELDLNDPPYELYMAVGSVNRYLEQLCHFYHRKYGMDIGILRPTNVYGPYDNFDPDKSHVLPALIQRALRKEDPFVVWGNGETVRDFLYVDDLIDDLLKILDRYCICDPLNVANGTATTIRQAVDEVLRVTGHRTTPFYDITKPTAIPYRMLDTAKFETIFGTPKRTPLSEGLRKTVEWYQPRLTRDLVYETRRH